MKNKSRLIDYVKQALLMSILVSLATYGVYCIETTLVKMQLPLTMIFLALIFFILCYQYNKLTDETKRWEDSYFHLDILFHKTFKLLKKHGGDKELDELMDKLKDNSMDEIVRMTVRHALDLPCKEESCEN